MALKTAKSFIFAIIVASIIASSANCEKASGFWRLLQSTMADPPQAESPQQLVATRPLPGCSLGPVCPPGNTILCENDEETEETGGCVCALVHLCHPGRRNCTFYGNSSTSGMPCGF